MRNENGESRGFGFVSYQTPDQGIYLTLMIDVGLIADYSYCRDARDEWRRARHEAACRPFACAEATPSRKARRTILWT